MKREQVLSSRTEKKAIGSYGSGKSFEIYKESDQEDNDVSKTIKKNGKVYCKWCDKNTKHSTWVSKQCIAHNNYINWKKRKDEQVSKK
mmetsp:Transcript_35992/g.41722  ORF Transcript_35992/g.41722 Transcript_35992/m.41722 type:complete len:88 (-) Transcript_35992:32-295(-)